MTTKHGSRRDGVTTTVGSVVGRQTAGVHAVTVSALLVAFAVALAGWPLAVLAGAVSAFAVFAVVSAVRGARATFGTGPDRAGHAVRTGREDRAAGRSRSGRPTVGYGFR